MSASLFGLVAQGQWPLWAALLFLGLAFALLAYMLINHWRR